MGRGKGKPVGRYCCLFAGTIIFELRAKKRAAVDHLFGVLQSKLQARLQKIVMPVYSTRQVSTYVSFYYSCYIRTFYRRRFKYSRVRKNRYKHGI
jgi:hypothetical protein